MSSLFASSNYSVANFMFCGIALFMSSSIGFGLAMVAISLQYSCLFSFVEIATLALLRLLLPQKFEWLLNKLDSWRVLDALRKR
jgi:hypothetical protein